LRVSFRELSFAALLWSDVIGVTSLLRRECPGR
jgi:hypothetical protein